MSVPVTGARLSLADFVPDSTTGVLLPPGAATPAGYLDGAERALLEGLPAIADRGTGSDELRTLMTDWPTSYHLTPYPGDDPRLPGLRAGRRGPRARARRRLRRGDPLARPALRRGPRGGGER